MTEKKKLKGKKQSLNLTNYAWYILRCDYSAFTNENTTSKNVGAHFLCRIFMSYYQQASASVGIRIRDRELEILRALGTHGNRELCDIFIKADKQKMVQAAMESFSAVTRHPSVPHTVYIPENVQSAIRDYSLGSQKYYYTKAEDTEKQKKPESQESPENIGRFMKYFRAVLEEYIRLPYYRREAVYFGETISTIDDALKRSCSISFRYGEEIVCGYPVAIESDEWSSFNYLLLADREMRINHYRICRIRSISRIAADTVGITPYTRSDMYEKQIIPAGIQFAGEPLTDVTVRLTEKGMEMYNRMVFLRPQYLSVRKLPTLPAEYICEFHCSANQIKFYFFKFGVEACVISPSDIRKQFLESYRRAYHKYSAK